MGSKSRVPPIHARHALPGPTLMHPEPFDSAMGLPPRPLYHSFDFPPSLEVMEQKVAAQHMEMERLVRENQRLADTHGSLRHELAAAQHELQMLQAKFGDMKVEREQEIRGLMDKIARMEAELETSETIRMQLQQASFEAQGLDAARQELISKVQQLNQELQRARADVKQVPGLMSELETLQQEYQHCRTTYEQERKNYNFQLESLKAMEREYMSMAREAEKLRAELANTSLNKAGATYTNTPGYNMVDASGHHSTMQNSYDDGYNVQQGRSGHFPSAGATDTGAAAGGTPYGSVQPAVDPTGYDTTRNFEAQRVAAYDSQRGGAPYDSQRGMYYDAQSGNAGPPRGMQPAGNAAYNPGLVGSMYDPNLRGKNPAPIRR